MVEGDFDKEDETFLNLKLDIDPGLWKNFSSFSNAVEKAKLLNNILMPAHIKAEKLEELERQEKEGSIDRYKMDDLKPKWTTTKKLVEAQDMPLNEKIVNLFFRSNLRDEERIRMVLINSFSSEKGPLYLLRNDEYFSYQKELEKKRLEREEEEKKRQILEENDRNFDKDDESKVASGKVPSEQTEKTFENDTPVDKAEAKSEKNDADQSLKGKNAEQDIERKMDSNPQKPHKHDAASTAPLHEPLPSFFDQTNISAFPEKID